MPNKHQEKQHFKAFRDEFKDFPDGELRYAEEGEVPDLKVYTDSGILGIEHTRLYYPQSKNGIVRQEQEELRKRVVECARRKFEAKEDAKINVEINFWSLYSLPTGSSDLKLTVDRIGPLALEIADFVSRNLPPVGETLFADRYDYPEDMPTGVFAINIYWKEKRERTIWSCPEGGVVVPFTQSYLSSNIEKKDCKFGRYAEECSCVWLLMVADARKFSTWFDAEMSDTALEATYETYFGRVFLFYGPENQLCELNVARRSLDNCRD